MKHDFIYDSSKDVGEKCYNFKREHQDSSILSSRIIFEKENVYLEAADDGKAMMENMIDTAILLWTML